VSSERTEDIEEAASDWLIRRDCGQWTEADQSRFELWLEATPLNRVAFLRLELAWEESARLKALGAGVPGHQPPPPGQLTLTPFFDVRHKATPTPSVRRTTPGTLIRRRKGLAIAASILLTVGSGLVAYGLRGESGDRYTTPVGTIASVPLLDGSNITLNTDSQVRVALTGAERHIELSQGEAFFEVAKDPRRPFVVEAGGKRVIAIGTKFSVQRSGDTVEVVVTEGKVRMEDANQPLSNSPGEVPASTSRRTAAPVFLTAGAIARADDAGVLVQRKSLEEAETQVSWRNGVLMFRDLSLADAAAEFNRYNARKIVIADAAVGALKVEGDFRATNVEGFVRLLEGYFPLQVAAQPDRITLRSR
jgi:transmembrane sensor